MISEKSNYTYDQDGIKFILGDCREGLKQIESGTVNTCVTSPPYWGLRDYGHDEQIGLEKTPYQFIDEMVEVFREVRRTLRDDGTLWLNLGDTYATGGGSVGRCPGGGDQGERFLRAGHINTQPNRMPIDGLKPKDLIGVPWRVALALQDDGWYLRQDIIWHKPNPMPESVQDRCTKAHEYIFLLSKSKKYHFDNQAIKEPAVCGTPPGNHSHKGAEAYDAGDKRHRTKAGLASYAKKKRESAKRGSFNGKTEAMAGTGQNAFRAVVDTRNKRSVWTVPVRPYKGAHFATFPAELIEPCVRAGAPEGGLVLDPFLGSGTTAEVAKRFGRRFVGCELNQDYLDLAKDRFKQSRLF